MSLDYVHHLDQWQEKRVALDSVQQRTSALAVVGDAGVTSRPSA